MYCRSRYIAGHETLSPYRAAWQTGVPLAQRIARWTSNPKVLGSIPRWDDLFFVPVAVAINRQEDLAVSCHRCFVSVVVITCASHAQGRRFEPGTKQYFYVFIAGLELCCNWPHTVHALQSGLR